jgi:hypothetical protein
VPWVGFRAVLIPLDEQISWSFVSSEGHECGTAMCDKCQELDKKIKQYERIAASINDQFTIDRIKALVEELRVQKAALHP